MMRIDDVCNLDAAALEAVLDDETSRHVREEIERELYHKMEELDRMQTPPTAAEMREVEEIVDPTRRPSAVELGGMELSEAAIAGVTTSRRPSAVESDDGELSWLGF